MKRYQKPPYTKFSLHRMNQDAFLNIGVLGVQVTGWLFVWIPVNCLTSSERSLILGKMSHKVLFPLIVIRAMVPQCTNACTTQYLQFKGHIQKTRSSVQSREDESLFYDHKDLVAIKLLIDPKYFSNHSVTPTVLRLVKHFFLPNQIKIY